MKDLSIIIVNYKGGERLARCLNSLKNIEEDRFSFEVVVVDNQSNDGRLPEFAKLFPNFTFLSNTGNNGFANGCNLGATNCTGRNLLFLNPDTTVSSEALYDMLEEIGVRPEYSIVSCGQVNENGVKERPYGKFLTLLTLTGWSRGMFNIFTGSLEHSVSQTKHYVYPDWVSGSVVMIRRDSFIRLGKWDEDFWMYFEDVDLCRRAKLRDGEVVKLKNSVVGHVHGGSSRLNPEITALTKAEVDISRHVYIAKHEQFLNAFFMHLFLILNNLFLRLIPATVGILFFFIKRLNICTRTYVKLVNYYLNVLVTGTWLSQRSVNYGTGNIHPRIETVFSNYKQVYH